LASIIHLREQQRAIQHYAAEREAPPPHPKAGSFSKKMLLAWSSIAAVLCF